MGKLLMAYQAKFYSLLVDELICVSWAYGSEEAVHADLRANIDMRAKRVIDFHENLLPDSFVGSYDSCEATVPRRLDCDEEEYHFNKKDFTDWMNILIEDDTIETSLFTAIIVPQPLLNEYDETLVAY